MHLSVCVLRMWVYSKCCNTAATWHHILQETKDNIVLVGGKEYFLFLFCFPSVFMWRTSAEQRDEKKKQWKKEGILDQKWISTLLCDQKKGSRNEQTCTSSFTSVNLAGYLEMISWLVTVSKRPGTNKLVLKILLAVLGICLLWCYSSFSFFFFPRTKSGLMNNWLRVPEQINSLQVFSGHGRNPVQTLWTWPLWAATMISLWITLILMLCGHYIYTWRSFLYDAKLILRVTDRCKKKWSVFPPICFLTHMQFSHYDFISM